MATTFSMRFLLLDSLFAVVTFTTIGYGDMTPTTPMGRYFGSLYALSGVAFLAISLGVIGSKLVEAEVDTIEAVEDKLSNDKMLSMFGRKSKKERKKKIPRKPKSAFSYLSDFDDTEHNMHEQVEDFVHPLHKLGEFWQETGDLLIKYVPSLVPLILGAWIIGLAEGWTFDQIVYYCIVTTTTIGYGDFTPKHQSTKLFVVLFIPFAVGAMGHFLGTVANFIMEQRMRVYDEKLWKHELTLEDLETMGRESGGTVTELDFVVFMLRAMKKVDGDLIVEIRKHFKKLNHTHSGTLVREDLEYTARHNLRTARSKLRLAQYKENLLRKTRCRSSVHDAGV